MAEERLHWFGEIFDLLECLFKELLLNILTIIVDVVIDETELLVSEVDTIDLRKLCLVILAELIWWRFVAFLDFLSWPNLEKQIIAFLKKSSPNMHLNSFRVFWSYSLNLGSSELMTIKKQCTNPICFRLETMSVMWSVSLPSESPMPGVSMTITGLFWFLPYQLVTTPFTWQVYDFETADALK